MLVKIIAIIDSCQTLEHLEVAENCIKNFGKNYEDTILNKAKCIILTELLNNKKDKIFGGFAY